MYEKNWRPDYSQVPADFPLPKTAAAIGGAQPKLLLTTYEGRYYAPGCTPPQVYASWKHCEDLAQHLATKALESKQGKRSHMLEVDILDQYLPRLIATKWTSESEARFVIRRVAEMLAWPVPVAASA